MHIVKDKNIGLMIIATAYDEWEHQIIVPLKDYCIDGPTSNNCGEIVTKFQITDEQVEKVVRKLLDLPDDKTWGELFDIYGCMIDTLCRDLCSWNDDTITDGLWKKINIPYELEDGTGYNIEGELRLILIKDYHYYV